jgi:hypothetical protein
MWVPPSRPYYNLEGVYKDSRGFSKILVFSSWEMVPKMIGSMISYEEERRTVGVVSRDETLKTTNNTYFTDAKLRYPAARLRFNVSKGEARGMYLLCLITRTCGFLRNECLNCLLLMYLPLITI